MSMPHLKESIQDLLHLQETLPRSLTDQIRVNNAQLLNLHDSFVDMASELRLWSFYETQESSLSGWAAGLPSEVQFGAPLVSVKSALLDLWQEDVYAVDSDHAHLASFESGNDGILVSYLADLAEAISKAALLNRACVHTPLHLRSHLKVEVIGFYEDPDASVGSPGPLAAHAAGVETGSIIRLYSTRYSFQDFLKKGPERCLTERLHRGPRRRPNQPVPHGYVATGLSAGTESSGLDFNTTRESSKSTAMTLPPEVVITRAVERRPRPTVPPFYSDPTVRPPSPESTASVSTAASESALALSGDRARVASHSIDLIAKQQARLLIREHELGVTAGFSRPNPSLRKFMWIHMPFNNPVWVKVRKRHRILLVRESKY